MMHARHRRSPGLVFWFPPRCNQDHRRPLRGRLVGPGPAPQSSAGPGPACLPFFGCCPFAEGSTQGPALCATARRGTPRPAGQCPISCHRSSPIRAAVSSSAAAAIQTPAICQALARGRPLILHASPSPSPTSGIHPRSQERQPGGRIFEAGVLVHALPTAPSARPPAAVDSRRPGHPQKRPGVPPSPGRAVIPGDGVQPVRGPVCIPAGHWRPPRQVAETWARTGTGYTQWGQL